MKKQCSWNQHCGDLIDFFMWNIIQSTLQSSWSRSRSREIKGSWNWRWYERRWQPALWDNFFFNCQELFPLPWILWWRGWQILERVQSCSPNRTQWTLEASGGGLLHLKKRDLAWSWSALTKLYNILLDHDFS